MDNKEFFIRMCDDVVASNKSNLELVKVIKQTWTKQASAIGFLKFALCAGIVYAVYTEKRRKKKDAEIEVLTKEVEELKRVVKGV